MDECLPPVIRDSRLFMLPFFKIWFKNSNIKAIMNFKKDVNHMSDADFAEIYRTTFNLSKDRPTDTNEASIDYILDHLKSGNNTNMLDVGCGRGYWLNLIADKFPHMELTGVDFFDDVPLNRGNYVRGNVEALPFPDKSFEIVTCQHTIEHLKNLPKAIEEMKRVARKQIIIATPCQRYYYYTLDLHLHFFPSEYSVSSLFGLKNYECKKIDGDWLYIGDVS
jgi:ubiquinone/menaquinone biosynthesis C-methylase UbiE